MEVLQPYSNPPTQNNPGEVIKFRVYNARENQKGGDAAENYFYQTESIAGIRDARFQAMMPDALRWLGVKRIDWLCSMSNEKYEAIVGSGTLVWFRFCKNEDFHSQKVIVAQQSDDPYTKSSTTVWSDERSDCDENPSRLATLTLSTHPLPGIKVMQRVTLPEDYVKENMKVEINAKVASGYNADYMGIGIC